MCSGQFLEVVPGAFVAEMTVMKLELLEMKESKGAMKQAGRMTVIATGMRFAQKKIPVTGKEFEHGSSMHWMKEVAAAVVDAAAATTFAGYACLGQGAYRLAARE